MSFFNLFDDTPIVRGDEKVKVKNTSVRVHTCEDCGICDTCNSPRMEIRGKGAKKILIVGEAPSREEDSLGFYGHGSSFNLLKDTLSTQGIDIFKDCWYTTAIVGYTKKRPPFALESCRKNLLSTIERLRPRAVVLLGPVPFNSLIKPLLTGRISGTDAENYYGYAIPDQHYKTYICPTYDASYMKQRRTYEDGQESSPLYERDPSVLKEWKSHFSRALQIAGGAFYECDYASDCFTTKEEEQAIEWIEKAMHWKKISFDYETSGIRPMREGHHIACVSISDGMFSYAFPFFDTVKFLRAYRKLMLSDVKKISHNANFESLWTKVICGYWPKEIYWDTMLAAHCIHSKKATGLKPLTYAYFGIAGYDDEVAGYLESSDAEQKEHGSNAFNRVDEAPLDKLMLYCAMDSLYTYKLYEAQKSQLNEFQMEGFKFFMESSQTLIYSTYNGLNVDIDMLKQAYSDLDIKMKEIEKRIYEDSDIKKWDGNEKFNYNSSTQLGHLLFDIMKVEPVAFTDTGKPSVDKDALPKYGIKIPFIKEILEYRKWAKLRDTYLNQYRVETVNGKVHAYFNLNRVDTMRSSCSSPNIQQIPKRDKESKKLLRDFLKPTRGNKITEYDAKSLEIVISACYSQDPTLVKFLTDPSADMHRASAADCFLLDESEVSKELRQAVKGQYNFALWYGSYYAQVAPDLWQTAEALGMKKHLASKGIKTFTQFEKHIKLSEEKLWGERFPVHAQWRKDQYDFYKKNGYVELKTGFRCYGPMVKNLSFNAPIQGSSYHLVQHIMNKVSQKVEQRLERSHIFGEIHDAILADVHPSEERWIDYWVYYYGSKTLKEVFPWVIIDLQFEKAESEVDGSWASMGKERYLTEGMDGNNRD